MMGAIPVIQRETKRVLPKQYYLCFFVMFKQKEIRRILLLLLLGGSLWFVNFFTNLCSFFLFKQHEKSLWETLILVDNCLPQKLLEGPVRILLVFMNATSTSRQTVQSTTTCWCAPIKTSTFHRNVNILSNVSTSILGLCRNE